MGVIYVQAVYQQIAKQRLEKLNNYVSDIHTVNGLTNGVIDNWKRREKQLVSLQ